MNILNKQDWFKISEKFSNSEPFNHVVIDDFFVDDIARNIFDEMPDYDGNIDAKYDNSL